MQNPEPAVIVIFGASGDLTQRKLIPALHTLGCEGFLPPSSQILGVARSQLTDQAFRQQLFEGVEDYSRAKPHICSQWEPFADRITYLQGDYSDPETYQQLAQRLAQLDENTETNGNRLFYLATPPALYSPIIQQLGKAGLNHSSPGNGAGATRPGWTRIVIEKPFGYDLQTAHDLNEEVHAVFEEDQVYRIDHYLGKETVQNILALRFANAIFEPLWNRSYIDHVQITVAEEVGVGHRAGYYDQAGILRDMFQNHLLQLLTLTAMEPPVLFEAAALRDEKVKVLRALRKNTRSVRAQYQGYCNEDGVAADSQTPTYALLQLFVDNWRWQGVPFYLRSGKSLAAKTSDIAIQFKQVPHMFLPSSTDNPISPNVLSLCLQPDEGMHLRFEAKKPGSGMQTNSVDMTFHYAEEYGHTALPEAYERLLLDALLGDASLFARADEIELAWSIIDPILASWEKPEAPALTFYEPGSWGPSEAGKLLGDDGRVWQNGCVDHD